MVACNSVHNQWHTWQEITATPISHPHPCSVMLNWPLSYCVDVYCKHWTVLLHWRALPCRCTCQHYNVNLVTWIINSVYVQFQFASFLRREYGEGFFFNLHKLSKMKTIFETAQYDVISLYSNVKYKTIKSIKSFYHRIFMCDQVIL